MTTFAFGMKTLEQYISDFLLMHDHLVVPQFGGFMSRKIAAQFSPNSNKISPPSKQIVFHSELHLADGILERYISNRKNLSLPESLVFINNAVLEWKKALKNGNRLEFDKIGVFFQDEDGKIRFIQDRDQNLLLSAYGLGDIRYSFEQQFNVPITSIDTISEATPTKAVISITHVNASTTQNTEESVNPVSEKEKIVLVQESVAPAGKKTQRFWIRASVAAVVLPFIFYSFWVPLRTDVLETKTLALIDFNPFHQIEQPRYRSSNLKEFKPENDHLIDVENIINSLSENTQVFNFNYDPELIMPVRIASLSQPKMDSESPIKQSSNDYESIQPKDKNIATQANSIHIISGCFSVKANAEKHLNELKQQGYDAYLVDVKGGLHRVAAGGATNQQEANLLLNQLQDQGISVWTLKK